MATINSNGDFSATLTNTTSLAVTDSPYIISYTYASDGTFSSASTTSELTVTQATSAVSVSDTGGTFDGTPFNATAGVTGVSGTGAESLEGVDVVLSYYSGTYTTLAQLTGLEALSGAPSQAGAYTAVASFPGSADYRSATALTNFTITQTTPAVSVVAASGIYDDAPFIAMAAVTGVNGVPASALEGIGLVLSYYSGTYTTTDQLSGLTPLAGAPSDSGAYTVLASFAGSTDYTRGRALTDFTIAQASSTVSVGDAGGTYSGSAFPATASVTGVSGSGSSSLEGVGLVLSYYSGTYTSPSQLSGLTPLSTAPLAVGAYTVLATFPGSTDYTSNVAVADFDIAQATPTVTVAAVGGTYKDATFSATAGVAGAHGGSSTSLEGVSLVLSYYNGSYTNASQLVGLTPLSSAPSAVGAYTALASFPGSPDYTSANAVANLSVTEATPTVSVSDPAGVYDADPFSATATVVGVVGSGAPTLEGVGLVVSYYAGTYSSASLLAGVSALSGAPTGAGPYTVLASFAGSSDYTSASAVDDFTIGQAAPTVSVTDAGGVYSGSAFAATATIAGVDDLASAGLEGVSLSLSYYAGSYSNEGQLAGVEPLPAAPSQAGSYTATATFAGSTDYAIATELANFTISKAVPVVTWGGLASIVYGTPLGAVQLDASANVAGSPVYSPPAGAFISAGTSQPLSVTFTPQDTTDFSTVTATTTLTVTRATPVLTLSDASGTYDGRPFAASVTITGAGNDHSPAASLEGVTPALTYYDGSGTSGVSLGSTAPSAAGTYTVMAAYDGSADYLPASSEPVTFTIGAGTATIVLAASSSSAVYGQPITFVATVAAPVAPSGTVTFFDGGSALATVSINASGVASLTTSALAFGSHSVTASFSGDASLTGAQSTSISSLVAKASTTIALVADPITKKKKVKSEVLKVSVEPVSPGSGLPGGQVIFELLTRKKKKTTTKVLGTTVLSGGAAVLTVKPTLVLSKAITIVYGGDANFLASTSTAPKLSKKGLL